MLNSPSQSIYDVNTNLEKLGITTTGETVSTNPVKLNYDIEDLKHNLYIEKTVKDYCRIEKSDVVSFLDSEVVSGWENNANTLDNDLNLIDGVSETRTIKDHFIFNSHLNIISFLSGNILKVSLLKLNDDYTFTVINELTVAANAIHKKIIKINDEKIAVIYQDTTTTYCQIFWVLSNGLILLSTQPLVSSINNVICERIIDGKAITSYRSGTNTVCFFVYFKSDNTITKSVETVVNSYAMQIIKILTSSKFLLIMLSGSTYKAVIVSNDSNDVITVKNETSLISKSVVQDISPEKLIIINYLDSSSAQTPTIAIRNQDLSVLSSITMSSAIYTNPLLFYLTENKCILFYVRSGMTYYRYISIDSSNTITIGNETTYSSITSGIISVNIQNIEGFFTIYNNTTYKINYYQKIIKKNVSAKVIGIALTGGGSGEKITIQVSGICNAFKGLISGQYYYITKLGKITLTETDYKIGYSLSSNELLIINEASYKESLKYYVKSETYNKTETDTKDTTTLNSAKSYTDTQITNHDTQHDDRYYNLYRIIKNSSAINVDDIKIPGIYEIWDACTGKPSGMNHFILICYPFQSNLYIKQVAYSVWDNKVAHRTWRGMSGYLSWTNWEFLSDTVDGFHADDNAIDVNDTSTTLATKKRIASFVADRISALVNSSPAALDTLNELAAALGNDANFSTTVTNLIATKLSISQNLNDLGDKATARTNLDVYGKSEVDTKDTTLFNTIAIPYMGYPINSDCNQCNRQGYYNAKNELTNAPNNSTEWFQILFLGTTQYGIQFAFQLNQYGYVSSFYIRQNINSVWREWRNILNAQSVDGFHADDNAITDNNTTLCTKNKVKAYVDTTVSDKIKKIIYSENATVDFSGAKKVVFLLFGGGGAGGTEQTNIYVCGGGGGGFYAKYEYDSPKMPVTMIIGAGATPVVGNPMIGAPDGGTTSLSINGILVASALGGKSAKAGSYGHITGGDGLSGGAGSYGGYNGGGGGLSGYGTNGSNTSGGKTLWAAAQQGTSAGGASFGNGGNSNLAPTFGGGGWGNKTTSPNLTTQKGANGCVVAIIYY